MPSAARQPTTSQRHPATAGATAGAGAGAGAPARRPRRGHLPRPLTELIGRRPELAVVSGLVAEPGLVTLVGPGGAGKTRLALAVARAQREAFADGAWWVELSALVDPGLVPVHLAAALDVPEHEDAPARDLLAPHLGEGRQLLVLDNCEHVVDAVAALVVDLVQACPRLSVLVTSREALDVAGEVVWPLAGLSVPPAVDPVAAVEPHAAGTGAGVDLTEAEAARFFAERARAVCPDFALTATSLPLVLQLCRRLDGLPLALELAAARMRLLTLEEIVAGLDDALVLLAGTSRSAPPRHRSLRATLDWSYQLLGEPERRLLRRLAAFRGSFPLAAATAVAAGEGLARADLPGLLERLVVKSWVQRHDAGAAAHGEARYAMLDVVAQYACEQLAASADQPAVERRHLQYYCGMAERAARMLSGTDLQHWLDQLDVEQDNLRLALARARVHDPPALVRLACGLARYWVLRGRYREGRDWLAAALAAPVPDAPGLRARALAAAGALALLQCDYPRAADLLEQSRALYRDLADADGETEVVEKLGSVAREQADYPRARALYLEALDRWQTQQEAAGVSRCRLHLGFLDWLQGDPQRAEPQCEQALAGYRSRDDAEGVTSALILLGGVALTGANLPRAEAVLTEALDRARGLGYQEGVAWASELLGLTACRLGDVARGMRLLQDSLVVHRRLGDRWRTASLLEDIAGVLVAGPYPQRAAELFGAAEALRAASGTPRPPGERCRYADHVAALRERLGGRDLQQWRSVGAARGLADVVALALAEPAPRPGEWSPQPGGVGGAASGSAAPPTVDPAFADPPGVWEPVPQGAPPAVVEPALADPTGRWEPVPQAAPPARGFLHAPAGDPAQRGEPASPAEPALPREPAPPGAGVRPVPRPRAPADLVVVGFGRTRVTRDGRELADRDWGYAKPRELLYYLLSRDGAGKAEIGADLWPDASPGQLRNSLHTALHALRAALGDPDWVRYERGRYAFDRGRDHSYDVASFLAAVRGAEEAPAAEAPALLGVAVDRYRGDFLADLPAGPWVDPLRAGYHRQFCAALATLGRLHAVADRLPEAVAAWQRLVAADPLSESGHRGLMRAYAHLGDRARALRQYAEVVDLLAAELGAAPSPETSELYHLLRAGRPV